MRYLLNSIYLFAFAIVVALAVPFSKVRREILPVFTRNFWGNLVPQLDGRSVVWVHAVSVGETLVCGPLIARLRFLRPDLQFVLSVGTVDGMTVALRELSETPVFYVPFDFSWSMNSVFDSIRPVALLIAENDFWPNMLQEARRRRVPLAIFNSRMSRREQIEHRWNAWLLRPGLQHTQWWGVVTDQDADWIRHFFRVPPERLEVTGSLKFDGAVRDLSNPRIQRLRDQFGLVFSERILVAGSTHSPEEELIVDVVMRLSSEFPNLRLVLAPRQISRCEKIEKLVRRKGVQIRRASDCPVDFTPSTFVTLVDSIGLLRDVWGLAHIAFVGGSLAEHGGQNLIEPASYGLPVCFGPHIWNFQSVVDEFLAAEGAVQIQSADELERTIRRWLINPLEAKQFGNRAAELIKNHTQAFDRTAYGVMSVFPNQTISRSLQFAEAL